MAHNIQSPCGQGCGHQHPPANPCPKPATPACPTEFQCSSCMPQIHYSKQDPAPDDRNVIWVKLDDDGNAVSRTWIDCSGETLDWVATDTNTTYTITGTDLVGSDGTTVPIPCVCSETVTELIDNGDNTFSYTNEAGTVVTVDLTQYINQPDNDTTYVPSATGSVITVTGSDGSVYSWDICAIVNANCPNVPETVTTLTVNADGSITYLSEDGTVTNVPLANSSFAQNTTTGEITHTSGNGNVATAQVTSNNTGNLIGTGTDGGSFLDCAALAANCTLGSISEVTRQNSATGIGGNTITHNDKNGNVVVFCEGFDSVEKSACGTTPTDFASNYSVGDDYMVRDVSMNGKELVLESAPEHFFKHGSTRAVPTGGQFTGDPTTLVADPSAYTLGPIGTSDPIVNNSCRPAYLKVWFNKNDYLTAGRGPSFGVRTRGLIGINGPGVIIATGEELQVSNNAISGATTLQGDSIHITRQLGTVVIIPPGGSATITVQSAIGITAGNLVDAQANEGSTSFDLRLNAYWQLSTLNQMA